MYSGLYICAYNERCSFSNSEGVKILTNSPILAATGGTLGEPANGLSHMCTSYFAGADTRAFVSGSMVQNRG